tara:strand:- start:17 stop:220 length:204 start_codon:yes stop_codon:yes gene_type:complete
MAGNADFTGKDTNRVNQGTAFLACYHFKLASVAVAVVMCLVAGFRFHVSIMPQHSEYVYTFHSFNLK